MMNEEPPWAKNPRVVDELRTQLFRIRAAVSADQLWNRVLTRDDRRLLGDDLETAWRNLGTVGMWQKIRKVSRERAIIEVGLKLGTLAPSTYEWLAREFGDQPIQKRSSEVPEWSATNGRLLWDGRLIRSVRIMGKPSHIQLILDSFQRSAWENRVKNPLTGGQQQLHQVLRSLNNKLKRIRFRAWEGGQFISWETR